MADATGKSYVVLAGELVLRPLAMNRSGFFQPPDQSQSVSFAVAHDGAGREIAGGWHVYPELAAAGLWSTPPDLARIILAMVAAQKGGNVAVLGADGLAAMLTSVDDLGYGLGVALQGEVRDRIAMKPGNNLGFRSGLCRLPRNGTGRLGWSNGQMPIAEGAWRPCGIVVVRASAGSLAAA